MDVCLEVTIFGERKKEDLNVKMMAWHSMKWLEHQGIERKTNTDLIKRKNNVATESLSIEKLQLGRVKLSLKWFNPADLARKGMQEQINWKMWIEEEVNENERAKSGWSEFSSTKETTIILDRDCEIICFIKIWLHSQTEIWEGK